MKIILYLTFLAIVSGGCPEDWTRFQQTCLALFKEALTWSAAQATCQTYNARLAPLQNQAKDMNMKIFLQLVEQYTQPVWVGGNDLIQESHWVWNDEDLNNLSYTKWLHGEPNNVVKNHIDGEDCLAVQVLPNTYGWMDHSCEERPQSFVCEKNVEPLLLIG